MPRKKSSKKKSDEAEYEDFLVIVTRTERRDYHYRVRAKTEEEAIEYAIDEWDPVREKAIVSMGEEFVDIIECIGRVEEDH